MNKKLRMKFYVYIKQLENLSLSQIQNLEALTRLLSNKKNEIEYIDLEHNIDFFYDKDNFTKEEISDLILYIINNNIEFYRKANESELMDKVSILSKELSIDVDEVKSKFLFYSVRKFDEYRKIYKELEEYILNIDNLSKSFEETLYNFNIKKEYIKIIIEKLKNNEEKEINVKEDNISTIEESSIIEKKKQRKKQLRQYLEIKKYIDCNLNPIKILNEKEIENLNKLMNELGYSKEEIEKVVRKNKNNIKNKNSVLNKNKLENLISNILSETEKELLMKSKELLNSDFSKNYNIGKLVDDIYECFSLILNSNEKDSYVDILKDIFTELSTEVENIELIHKNLKYS